MLKSFNLEKLKIIIIKIGLIIHTIFHYTDIITDYFLTLQVYENSQKFEKEKKLNWYFLFSTLVVMILIERYKSYHFNYYNLSN